MLKALLLLLALLGLTMANPESSSAGRPGGGGYWDIRLSPNSITSVPFGAGHVTVWEHAESPGRFYAMPLVYLLHESAETRLNVLIGKYEMKFDVLMWSVEAREAVFRHLQDEARPSKSCG